MLLLCCCAASKFLLFALSLRISLLHQLAPVPALSSPSAAVRAVASISTEVMSIFDGIHAHTNVISTYIIFQYCRTIFIFYALRGGFLTPPPFFFALESNVQFGDIQIKPKESVPIRACVCSCVWRFLGCNWNSTAAWHRDAEEEVGQIGFLYSFSSPPERCPSKVPCPKGDKLLLPLLSATVLETTTIPLPHSHRSYAWL